MIYQCKGTESRLVLVVCAKDFNDEKYREIIMKIRYLNSIEHSPSLFLSNFSLFQLFQLSKIF